MRKGEKMSAGQREKLRAALNRPEVREKRHRRIDSRGNVLCAACRDGNCNACNGGDCRCVCALELDRKVVRRGSRAA